MKYTGYDIRVSADGEECHEIRLRDVVVESWDGADPLDEVFARADILVIGKLMRRVFWERHDFCDDEDCPDNGEHGTEYLAYVEG